MDFIVEDAVTRHAYWAIYLEVKVNFVGIGQDSGQRNRNFSQKAVFFLNNLGAFSLRQILLLVENRGSEESLRICQFTQREFFVICSVKGELQNLIPSRHNSLVRVRKLDDCLAGVVVQAHFDIGLHVRLRVQSARVKSSHPWSFILK